MEEKLKKYIIIFKEGDMKEIIGEMKAYLREGEKLEPYKIIPGMKATLYESTKKMLEEKFSVIIEENSKVYIC